MNMNPLLASNALAKPIKQPKKARRPIRKVSKSMAANNSKYNRIAAKFKRDHPICQAHHKIFGLLGSDGSRTQDIHHSRGKLGNLRFDTRFFIPVCRKCHIWIGNNKNLARAVGLLCEVGQWNVAPKD